MDKNIIINNPDKYIDNKNKSIEARLNEIRIDENITDDIIKEKGKEVVIDKLLGMFKVGEVISTVLNINKDINEEIKKAKEEKLLEEFFNKVDGQENCINALKNFITNPYGNIIFNKILAIINDYPVDIELIAHLSTVLTKIVITGEFEKLFEQHKFVLAQIELLTPQSLSILSDYKSFPIFKLDTMTAMGSIVTSSWETEFAEEYCKIKKITDLDISKRVWYTIQQLKNQGYIEAITREDNSILCTPTYIAKNIIQYIELL